MSVFPLSNRVEYEHQSPILRFCIIYIVTVFGINPFPPNIIYIYIPLINLNLYSQFLRVEAIDISLLSRYSTRPNFVF